MLPVLRFICVEGMDDEEGESFKLDYQWWKKGRPVALKSTGLGNALQVYQKNQSSPVQALEALLKLDAARKKAITMCNRPMFAETKAALQRADALDLAIKVNLRLVVQGQVGTLADATTGLKSYVETVPRLIKEYEAATNPGDRKRLAREIGVNAQYVRDGVSRGNTAAKTMIDHQATLKQDQSLWTRFTDAKRDFDKVAGPARDVMVAAHEFRGGD